MAAQFSAAKERKDTVDVEEPLGKLKLSESKRQGVVLVKADRESLPEVKWMAAARLLTVKNLSEQSLISTMKAAWKFRPIGKNLFVVQANCLGDWKRIMEEGPWLFRGGALMLEEYDGATVTPSVMPNRVQAWIQIHKLPPLYRTEAILKQLAGRGQGGFVGGDGSCVDEHGRLSPC